jgi:histidine kinase-like protein
VFPGEEAQLGLVRGWLAALLPACPARDDVAVVATELGSNAIRHTASGRGGRFAVEITFCGAVVRVAVADSGARSAPRMIEDPVAESGRGLLVVRGLSVSTGVRGGPWGRLVWADVPWQAMGGAMPEPTPGEGAHGGEVPPARRYSEEKHWAGRYGAHWEAAARPAGAYRVPVMAASLAP